MLYAIILAAFGIIFHNWFTVLPISSGDLSFFFHEQIIHYFNLPFMWETFRNLGFGGDSFLFQGVYLYNLPFGILGKYFDYGLIERIIWFFPILIVSFISPLVLGKTLKLFSSKYYPLITLIYILNTYYFIIMGGGQLTIVFGYLLIPIAFSLFLKALQTMQLAKILLFCTFLSLLAAADFRSLYIFLTLIFLYTLFSLFFIQSLIDVKTFCKRYATLLFFSLLVGAGTHAYWLLPYLSHYHSPVATIGDAYTSTKAVIYFSFAQLVNSIALFHPYFPDNIFGKVGFMKPEYFLFPLFAFTSLFFISKKVVNNKTKVNVMASRFILFGDPSKQRNQIILFFSFVAIIGAFLAKGANPPFGTIYIWMFHRLPGFIMFRDSTKWYALTALSYAVLIPNSIVQIYDFLGKRFTFRYLKYFSLQNVFLALSICSFLLLIRQTLVGEFGGTLQPIVIPHEYIAFKNFLITDKNYSRVLWVPTMQRFTFYSDMHPAIQANDFFNSFQEYGVVSSLQKKGKQEYLQKLSIKYVVIPDDTQKEIFLRDRKYDRNQYETFIKSIRHISWLHEIKRFDGIYVFAIDNPKDHVWSQSNVQLTTRAINPTVYTVQIKNAHKGDTIVFSEFFDKNWYVNDGEDSVQSTYVNTYANNFILKKSGNYSFTISYKPQELVPTGIVISILSVCILFASLVGLSRKKW